MLRAAWPRAATIIREDPEAFDPAQPGAGTAAPHAARGGKRDGGGGGRGGCSWRAGHTRADTILFEKERGRWCTLPRQMSAGRRSRALTVAPAL